MTPQERYEAALVELREARAALPDGSHGRASNYTNDGCRCDLCRAAAREHTRRMRDNRVARLKEDPSIAPHGSVSTYKNYGCRCAPCVAAHSAECAARAARRKVGQ